MKNMSKVLAVLGAIVLGAAAIAGTVYAVLYFQRKQKACGEDCYIDGDCGCGGDDYEDYLDDDNDAPENFSEEAPTEGNAE